MFVLMSIQQQLKKKKLKFFLSSNFLWEVHGYTDQRTRVLVPGSRLLMRTLLLPLRLQMVRPFASSRKRTLNCRPSLRRELNEPTYLWSLCCLNVEGEFTNLSNIHICKPPLRTTLDPQNANPVFAYKMTMKSPLGSCN